ncbi:hypothetical protein FQR65_LT18321 [Abscondita terminalis]|nr:hypothetical protein FQR65_LT18321 [Abscondita terminalis]
MNDEKLIELVRNYPVLYDLSNAKYMDTNFKNTIWRKIGDEMKTTGTSCKTRWGNIRDNFRKSLKKTKTVSGQKAKTAKPYKYSEQLNFLKKFFDDKETMSNIDAEVTSQDFSDDDEVSESPENEENTQNDTVEDNNSKRSVPNSQPPKTAAATVMEYIVKRNENIDFSPSTPQHPVDAFLAGIAPALKKLPQRYWHYAKADIFAAVQKYELKMIMDQEQILALHPASCSSPAYFQQPSPIERYQQSNNSSTLASPPSEDFQHETNSSADGNQQATALNNIDCSLQNYFQRYTEL